jgi:SAM-dependent methyltransferase
MPIRRDLHRQNRRSWDAATVAHNSHKGDQARFLREGGSTLFPEEIDLLGDLAGVALVHLQCNSGQDSLSLAWLGAVVTGVDFSDEAIACAEGLARDAAIAAEFVRADVYDWLDEAGRSGRRFDVAFSSYGALCWLSDLDAWARGISGVLRPGGRLVLVEFHPLALMFDERWALHWPYSSGGDPLEIDGVGDYVARSGDGLVPWGYREGIADFRNPHRAHEFAWGLGDLVTALLGAGLVLEALREYPYSNGARLFSGMREVPGRRMLPPEGIPHLPLMFGLSARKPRRWPPGLGRPG